MSKRLVALVDFHKTGTITLQESFLTNRETLKELGILHPDCGLKAHHYEAWALNWRT